MRPIRSLLLVLAVLSAVLLALALGLYGIARLPWFESRVAAQLTHALGLPVAVEELALGYFPQPWIELDGLSVAADNAAAAERIVEVERVRLVVPWRTVFGRGLRVERVAMTSPRVHLRRAADGRASWDELAARLADLLAGESIHWSVGSLDLGGGSVDYRDDGQDTTVEAAGVALTGEDLAPGRFFPMQLRAALQSAGYVFHASFAGQAMVDPDRDAYAAQALTFTGWLGGGELGLAGVELAATIDDLAADLAKGIARVHGLAFSGLGVQARLDVDVTALDTAPVVAFEVATAPFAPRTTGYSLNKPLPATTDPGALGRAAVALQGEWSAAGLQVADLHGELDDSRFSGSLWWPTADLPPRLRLDVDQVDLDRYLPPESPQAGTAPSPQAALEALLAELRTRTVDVVITVGVAQAAGVTANGLTVTLVPDAPAPGQGVP